MRYISILALAFVTALPLWGAAPSISGVSQSESTMTITGSNFGSKSPAAPVIWDTFERGEDTTSADIGTWTSIYYQTMTVQNSVVYSGSYSIRGDLDYREPHLAYHFCRLIKDLDLTDGSKVFASVKRRYTDSFASGTENCKLWRISPSASVAFPDYLSSQLNNGGFHNTEPGLWTVYSGNPAAAHTHNNWHHEEFIFQRASDIDAADGVVIWNIDTANQVNRSNLVTRTTAYSSHMRYFFFDNQMTTDGYVYMDDCYLDNTWARVAIGSHDTWAASTQREMQIPTSWANDAIEADINTGQITGTAYLYVWNADNEVNATGYEITIPVKTSTWNASGTAVIR